MPAGFLFQVIDAGNRRSPPCLKLPFGVSQAPS